jgi:hypothetical protein
MTPMVTHPHKKKNSKKKGGREINILLQTILMSQLIKFLFLSNILP